MTRGAVAWLAGVNTATVMRWVGEGVLTGYRPECAAGELRPVMIFWLPEVVALIEARSRVARRA